jgi:hypothetical protein
LYLGGKLAAVLTKWRSITVEQIRHLLDGRDSDLAEALEGGVTSERLMIPRISRTTTKNEG